MYLEHSKEYLSRGISVIPCAGKKVCTRNFGHYANRLPNSNELKFFEANFATRNIALMMGRVNNLMCIDIDTNDQEVIDFVIGTCGETVAKFGSKGMTYIYRTEDTFENKMFVSETKGCMLEFLCNGRFTVIPPSKHPNGNNYVWKSANLLDSWDDLPVIAESQLDDVESYMRKQHNTLELKEIKYEKALL